MSLHPITGLPLGDGAATCGDCAWREEGRCLFVALGEQPGPQVTETAPGCAFHEPPVHCEPCGACCREAFDSVPVDDDDLARLEPTHRALVRTHADGWRDLDRVPTASGCGTRCIALRGDGEAETPYRCAIYDQRPTNCRDLERGSAGCLTARRRVGLTPWAPSQRADGPLVAPTC